MVSGSRFYGEVQFNTEEKYNVEVAETCFVFCVMTLALDGFAGGISKKVRSFGNRSVDGSRAGQTEDGIVGDV